MLLYAAICATAAIPSTRDATLYEDPAGAYASGEGDWIFAGRTRQNASAIRRAVLFFDVASWLPPDARVVSAELRLFVSQTISGEMPVSVHRVLSPWGEGASNASGIGGGGTGAVSLTGDATWIHAFKPGTLWKAPGGDFAGESLALAMVGGVSNSIPVTWTGTDLTASVQAWVDDPASNFGWILLGDESAPGSAKRFNSRENPDAAARPELFLVWTTVPEPSIVPLCAAVAIVRAGRRKRSA